MTTETERELLELAAKAAGIEFDAYASLERMLAKKDGVWWRPFDDDGDALRLAVKIPMDICRFEGACNVTVFAVPGKPVTERYENDPYAATRRAIVRAAAEIGRAMK